MTSAVQKIADHEDFQAAEMNEDFFRIFCETAPVNIIFADKDLNIRYMNNQSRTTLLKLEKLLPISVDHILGKSIDIFHKNPAHQREILSNPRNLPHKASFKLGPETLELNAQAVYSKKGVYEGVMVAWDIITEKQNLANQANQMRALAENAPINIMLADRDFKIVYLNPASKNTLKKLRLPYPLR